MNPDSFPNRCLNCGEELRSGNYCPSCGQSRNVSRLTLRNFTFSLLSGLTRINHKFLFTCRKLLIQPWNVIHDYLIGRRQRYTHPVQTLFILCFISVILSSWVGQPESQDSIKDIAVIDGKILGNWVIQSIKWYLSSPTFQNLTLFIPAVPAFMLITSNRGVCRYNFAECLLAAIYISSSVFLFRLIVSPIAFLLGIDITWLSLIYTAIIGYLGVFKSLALRCYSYLNVIFKTILFFCLALINYFIIGVFIILLTYYSVIK